MLRKLSGTLALVAVALIGTACSGSPAGPGVLSSDRRVQDGGAGGTLIPGFTGKVDITASGGTLSGNTEGANQGSNSVFEFKGVLAGTGRFQSGFIDLQVNGTSADVRNLWFSNGKQTFQDKGKTVPATVEQAEKCMFARDVPGVLIRTTINATFENFGNTTIVEEHCVPQ